MLKYPTKRGEKLTVSLVRVVVEPAIEIPVALEMLSDAKRIISASKVGRFVAVPNRLHFRPNGPESTSSGNFIRRRKPFKRF